MIDKSSKLPLSGLRVLEFAEDIGGELAGRLFAELGADVTKLEPPQGAYSRHIGPFANGQPGPEASLTFRFYNRGKKSIAADLNGREGRQKFDALLVGVDLFICTLQPSQLVALDLSYDALLKRHPKLIVVSVTPFGLTGPWADYKSSDLIGLAAGGPLHVSGYSDHTVPPIRPGGDQAYHAAASFAYSGAMLALLDRRKSGRGQLVDVAMHEACAVTVELAFAYWAYAHAPIYRQTCRHAQPFPSQPTLFECADGRYFYFVLILAQPKAWEQLVSWLDSEGMAADLTDPVYSDVKYRQENFHHIQGICESFFLLHNADDLFRAGQARQLPVGVVYSPEDLLQDPHLKERGFFVEIAENDGSTARYPGLPYRFSSFLPPEQKPAPVLGSGDASEG